MDSARDLEFHDDNSRALEKAKESILLMKKKMFRSHDLILQYNNKLKECERLKGDLCVAQEEALKFKRENNANLSKVVKLEMLSADHKKKRHELEKMIAEKDIQIAGDKSNLQQLEYKLEAVEEKNAEKTIEGELAKSALEVKVKKLEQEIRSLKKSHMTDMNKLGKALLSSPRKKKGNEVSEVVKEMKEIGVNTVEIEPSKPIKPATVDKSLSTNECDRIRGNPYAVFCDNCESSMEPKVEKICKIMAHPPLVGNLLSPVRPRLSARQPTNHQDSNYIDANNSHNNETRREIAVKDSSRLEANPNEMNRVDPNPRNFVPSPQLSVNSVVQENQGTSLDATVPELDKLRRKISILERKIKVQMKQQSTDTQQLNGNCCSHQHPLNYCGHASTHVNPSPTALPNMQADLMTEFFNRMMNFTNQREVHKKTAKVDSRREKQTLRDRRAKIKLRKLKKINRLKGAKNCETSNWEIESDDKDDERNGDPSDPTKPHLLRIKPSLIHPSLTPFNNVESEQSETLEDPSEEFLSAAQQIPLENVEKTPEKVNCNKRLSNKKSTIESPKNVRVSNRGRKRKKALYFSDESASEIEDESVKTQIGNDVKKNHKKSTNATKTRDKSLQHKENEKSLEKSSSNDQKATISTCDLPANESASILSDGDVQEMENNIVSQNSTISESISNAKDVDDVDESEVPPGIDSHSEALECKGSQDGVTLRKRKRASSPKAPKRTRQATLMVKLRALKKNSTPVVAASRSIPTIPTTRSLSRRKLTEPSESDDSEAVPKEASPVASSESNLRVPVKKQRIAHVPKPGTSLKTSKSSDCFEETCESTDERQPNDSKTAETKRLLDRRLAAEKLALSKSKDIETRNKSGENDQTGMPVGVVKKRRGRPPKQKPIELQPILDTRTKDTTKSLEHKVEPEKAAETPDLGVHKVTDLKDVTEDIETSLENIRQDDKGSETLQSLEKAKSSVSTESVDEENLIVQSNTASQSISAADASIKKTEAARVLPAEKSSASLEAPPTSPAHSVAPLESVSGKSAEVLIPMNEPAVSLNDIEIETTRSGDNSDAKNTSFTNETDAPAIAEYSADKPGSVSFVGTRENDTQNAVTLDESKNSMNDESVTKMATIVDDESPASPEAAPSSSVTEINDPTIQSPKPEQRVSVYDSIVLPISPFEETVHNNLSTDNAEIFDTPSADNSPRDTPIEKPIERSLVVYDMNVSDCLNESMGKNDSKNLEKPSFFAKSADLAKKKATQSNSGQTIGVVKALRSRQVLCSPSTSANNPQNIQSSMNNENKNVDSTNADVPQNLRYSGVRSIGTLLSRHLNERKKKNMGKLVNLRKAGAIKVQKTAENTVKVELVKLAESEEWTSELHQRVIAKLRDIPTERTIAKSIVDFLVERAALDEPLDRTHTPPAPVMTKTQQRIVTLVNCLQQENVTARLFDLIQAGIEYHVFKTGPPQSVEIIEYLIRIFTVISRIRKDRERVRILCCDVMYFTGRRAIPVLHTILTIWPEVLPNHGTVASEIPNCLVHLIRSTTCGQDPFPKIKALKTMLTDFYEYPNNPMLPEFVMKVLMKAIHENYSSDLEPAIILISKREGLKWTLNNAIEKGLMTIIKDDNYQWKFEAFSLLGFVLRTFPAEDDEKTTKKFVDLFCEMLHSSKGSPDAQEGVVSALLSLSRHKPYFAKIASSLLKWIPSRDLRASTLEQVESFFATRTPIWWNIRLQYELKSSAAKEAK